MRHASVSYLNFYVPVTNYIDGIKNSQHAIKPFSLISVDFNALPLVRKAIVRSQHLIINIHNRLRILWM